MSKTAEMKPGIPQSEHEYSDMRLPSLDESPYKDIPDIKEVPEYLLEGSIDIDKEILGDLVRLREYIAKHIRFNG